MSQEENFEAKITNAKAILEKLMDPALPMDESITAYQEGMKELQIAEKMLEQAQLQIQILKNQEQ